MVTLGLDGASSYGCGMDTERKEMLSSDISIYTDIVMTNSTENLYQLDGRVPLGKAVPFGLQHVLAMFVSNIAPIMILASAIGLDKSVSAVLVQNCMVIAGIGTLVQLYPVWRIGSRLPIVMGISFTFLSLAISIGAAYGMGTLIGDSDRRNPLANTWQRNVGLAAMSGVVNRFTIGVGAVVMIVGGIFPAIGYVLTTIPQAVLGGCTIMMFGSILFAGFGMMARSGFSQRNMIIVSLSLSVGLGFTQATDMFNIFPEIVRTVFADNCVAVVFLLAVMLNLLLPKDKEDAADKQ